MQVFAWQRKELGIEHVETLEIMKEIGEVLYARNDARTARAYIEYVGTTYERRVRQFFSSLLFAHFFPVFEISEGSS